MIIDEKVVMQPPPSYASSTAAGLPPFPAARAPPATLTALPAHLLLHIIYLTFPQTPLPDEATIQRQRKTLYWISISLRTVNRTLYAAAMHVLRSIHLPAYDALVRRPYSTDPFPTHALHRESATLDRFIALKVREDVWADDSELHLERDEAYKDLFDLLQPRSRLEDLVREYGVRDGVVCVGAPQPQPIKSPAPPAPAPAASSSSSPSPRPPTSFLSSLFRSKKPPSPSPTASPARHTPPIPITPLPFHLLSISFSPRLVGLLLHSPPSSPSSPSTSYAASPGGLGFAKRTIVSTPRARDERLEVCAKRLVRELRRWLEEGG